MIRSVTAEDVPELLDLIRELAAYQQAAHQVAATELDLHRALFAPHPAVFAHVAVGPEGRIVGYVLWYRSFSPWLGRHGIWIADLYVQPRHRDSGLGRSLLAHLAQLCVECGYGRIEWKATTDNFAASGFYAAIGAQARDGWSLFELRGEPLRALASTSQQLM